VVKDYCARALAYLSHAYDPRRSLFSCASTVDRRGQIVNDFTLPWSLRYTINTYLGLSQAERHGADIGWLGDVRERVGRFLVTYEHAIENGGDNGLLLTLLAETDRAHPAAPRSLVRLEHLCARRGSLRQLTMQELAWMLWGVIAWAESPRAQALADCLFELIRADFVHATSGMPRHSLSRHRTHAVSFGAVVYFLRAMYEYGEKFDSREARNLFDACLRRVLAIQRADGAWPWMIDVRTALPIDVYPIFSVHQDSMAMLFLFPAQRYGVAGIEDVIQRSLGWNLGRNELNTSLIRTEPSAWFYRSIERREHWPRARRYLRGLGPAPRAYPCRTPHVRFNRECRSYHPGWVLYTWSERARSTPEALATRAEPATDRDGDLVT
jgi:hypothetical protein